MNTTKRQMDRKEREARILELTKKLTQSIADREKPYALGHYFIWARVKLSQRRAVRACLGMVCTIDPNGFTKRVMAEVPGIEYVSLNID